MARTMLMTLALALPLGLAAQTKTAKAADYKPFKDAKAVEAAMNKAGCLACHQVKRKVVGPAYVEIAKKYRGDKDAVKTLSGKVKKGGSGVWGKVPMTPHPKLKDDEIEAMVRWVLAQE